MEITYSLIHCYKHLREKAIIYLNFDDYKDTDNKVEKFEDIVDDLLLKNSCWYLVPSFIEYKIKTKRFKFSNVVELVQKKRTSFIIFIMCDFTFDNKFCK